MKNGNQKPIIGIISKHFAKEEVRPNMFVRDEVKQALFDNGAIAIGILLPKDEVYKIGDNWTSNFSKEEFENLKAQLDLCDGIVFQGGDACDNYEMIVAKYCYDNDIPTLGICCGQNVMVRAVGGTTKYVSNPEKHFDLENIYSHKVKILKDTKLYNILQKDEIMVNSRHKKTVDSFPNLIANCVCEDGYIDGVESKDKKFYMAFRFHSESLYKIDKNHKKIIQAFVDVCK